MKISFLLYRVKLHVCLIVIFLKWERILAKCKENREALSAFWCGVYYVEKDRGRKIYFLVHFHSPKQLGIFYFYLSALWQKNTDIHTTCQSYNLPVWSINYEVFQRNTWIKQTVCHPILALAVDCEFTMLYCHSFWYFITCIHFSLFWVWCVGSVLTLQIYSKSKTPPLIDISVKA